MNLCIPARLVHEYHFKGLLPYATLHQTKSGWYTVLGNWRIFAKISDDPIYRVHILEGPNIDNGKLYLRHEMREAVTREGKTFAFGLTGSSYIIGFNQQKGLPGDFVLYYTLELPKGWRNKE